MADSRRPILPRVVAVFGLPRCRPGKTAHSPDVSRRETAHARELGLEILGQFLDDGLSPTLGALALDDQLADLPVEFDKFPVDGQRGAELGRADTLFELREKLMVALGDQVLGFARPAVRFLAHVALPGPAKPRIS